MAEFSELEKKIIKSMYRDGFSREEILNLIDSPEFEPEVYFAQKEFVNDSEELFNKLIVEADGTYYLKKGVSLEQVDEAFSNLNITDYVSEGFLESKLTFGTDGLVFELVRKGLGEKGPAIATAMLGLATLGISVGPDIMFAQSQNDIIVSGNYADQLGNPIIEANVEHLETGNIVQTGLTGEFNIQIPSVSVDPDDTFVADEYRLGHNWPNPFNPSTKFEVETLSLGTVTIYNILGQEIDNINLPRAGYYTLSWGGLNKYGKGVASGIYIYVLRADDQVKAEKMTLLDGGGSSGLGIVSSSYGLVDTAKTLTETDTLRFIKQNTSTLEFAFNHENADINLGDIIGNVGPSILDTIPDQVLNVGDTIQVNMNDFVYNDETGLYVPRDSANFDVEESLVTYIAAQPETLSTWIDIVDSTDAALRDSLMLRVFVPYVNQPPTQTAQIPNQSIAVDSLVQLLISQYVSDPENDPLTADIPELQNATYEQVLDTLKIIPTVGYVGTIDSVVINISDGEHNIDLNSFNITVYEDTLENTPPEQVADILNQTTNEDEPLSLVMRPTYVTDVDNDSLQYLISTLPDATYEVEADTITITPSQDYNGRIDSIVVNVSDGQAAINLNPFSLTVEAVNDAPVFAGTVPNQETVEDSLLTINVAQYFTDVDNDTLDYIIQNLSNATQATESGIITITPSANWNGTLEGLIIEAQDTAATAQSNQFNIEVAAVNDAPVFAGTVPNYTVPQDSFLVINAAPFFTDIDNDTLEYIIQNLVNATQTIQDSIITVTPTPSWNGSITGLILEGTDGEYTAQSNQFDITVTPPPMATVHFILKDFYTDSTITADTSTFWIGDSTYYSTNGELTVELPQGTYEFNATNPNTWDGASWWNAESYLGLMRPGDEIPFEKRHGLDNSSPITISSSTDTIYANKIVFGFPLGSALTYMGAVIVAFGNDDQDAPMWWNTNYMPPDSTRLQWTQDLKDEIQAVNHVRLTLPIIQSTETPTEPYLWTAVDSSFPSPGTNGTTYDDQTYEIIECHARYPPWPDKYTFYIEILQAMFDMEDPGGTDPPIIGVDGINETGHQFISLSSFYGAGFGLTTQVLAQYIESNSDMTSNMRKIIIQSPKAPNYIENATTTPSDIPVSLDYLKK
ncbi:MAG: cadherin-like domain-containing protein [Nanoarchaeota archaeon]|nr:cadherin-like domain-containing protein [DPANN group archaeon]MBL7116513.1 cadherin-like domain-containing protein [Nanoarchaeota archaeon]